MQHKYNIIIVLFLSLFLIGCVQEGIKIVQVSNTTLQNAAVNANPASTVSNASNQTAPANNTVSNTTTNTTANTGTPTNADLAVSNFFLSTLNPRPFDEFEVTFKIKNGGTQSIKDFEYSIKIMKGNDVKKSENYAYSSEIAANSMSEKIEKVFSLEQGDYELILALDSSGKFLEPDESNNIKKQRFSVFNPSSSNSSSTYNSSHSPSSNTSSSDNSGCTDTDGGATYDKYGVCTDKYGSTVGDVCLEVNKLWEWRCVSGRCVSEYRTCTCLEGKCV
jgi:hypothetical protein